MNKSGVTIRKTVIASAVIVSGVSAFGLAMAPSVGFSASSEVICGTVRATSSTTATTPSDLSSLIQIPACEA